MCYDLHLNKTLFDREIMEGVFCVICGMYYSFNDPLCIIGGNCSVIGVDSNGNDQFWTVLGGNTICMTLSDTNGDGQNELIVGTDDFSIRFYQGENLINEINENTKIIELRAFGNSNFFSYALENGTIGVYQENNRKWKMKEKGYVCTIIVSNFNQEKTYEILCGWSTGKIQMREGANGKIILETDIGKQICKMLYTSFVINNNRKKSDILCFTSNGEVYGYEFAKNEKFAPIQSHFIAKDKSVDQNELNKYESLYQEKNNLMEKLEDLAVKESNKAKINSPKDEIVLPKDTSCHIDLQSNNEKKCADLIIESSAGTVVKMVIIISEQLYKGETYIKYPSQETNKVIIQIKTKKDLNINLNIKVLVGKSYYLEDYQVYEYNKIIPKYCFYILLRDDIEYKSTLIQGIKFEYNERIDRLILWLEQNFNIPKKELDAFRKDENNYCIRFSSLRTDKVLEISVKMNELSILTEEVELCGNIFQDMCNYFKINESNTKINYEQVVKSFGNLVEIISSLDKERNQFNINMTEIISFIKDLFVKAEDNRLLDNIPAFNDYFRKINVKNLELLDEFEKRTKVYEQLITDLKKINENIQTFSNLKFGKYKNKMINDCRDCVRKKNYPLLLKIFSTGEA